MKLAAKIFTIIGMVMGALLIVPLVIGIISLKKQNAGEVDTLWKVLTLILCNPIAGILLFFVK